MRTAGRLHPRRAHLLAKILWCPCGRAVRAQTHTNKQGRQYRRYRHDPPCDRWQAVTRRAELIDAPIVAQLSQLRVDDATVARLRERAGEPIPVDTRLQRRAVERDLERRAADHAARRITTEAYLAEHTRLTAELDGLSVPLAPSSSISDGDVIVRFLSDLKASWVHGGEWERAKLVASVYGRVVVNDREVVEVELTEDAKRHGLAWALPEKVVVVLARPARLEVTTFRDGSRALPWRPSVEPPLVVETQGEPSLEDVHRSSGHERRPSGGTQLGHQGQEAAIGDRSARDASRTSAKRPSVSRGASRSAGGADRRSRVGLGSRMGGLAAEISRGYTLAMSKILVSLPDDLLERIDREARARGSTRSRFLQEAAWRQLGWPSHGTLEAALGRGRAALAGVGSFESADVVHEQRVARDARDRRRL